MHGLEETGTFLDFSATARMKVEGGFYIDVPKKRGSNS